MGRLYLILAYIYFLLNPCQASLITFAEDDKRYDLRRLQQSFSIPSKYTITTTLPGALKAHRWLILYHTRKYGPMPIGSLSMLPPDETNSSDIYLAFDHTRNYACRESCLKAITLALVQECVLLAEAAGFNLITTLKIRDLTTEKMRILSEQMNRIGWQVREISRILGMKDFLFVEYRLQVEPQNPADQFAIALIKQLRAKL